MNELLFFGHLTLIVLLTLGALRLGKEALMIAISLFSVLANAFILKETCLFGLTVTCTDAYAIGSLLALNLLQRYYGTNEAKRALIRSLLGLAIFALLSLVHLAYAPASDDRAHDAFTTILSHSPRIVGASLFSFYLIQRFDIALFGMLSRLFKRVPGFVLMGISLGISQTIDTFIFSYLGLYGLVSSIGHIIVMTLVIKGIAIGFMSPLSGLARYFIPREAKHAA